MLFPAGAPRNVFLPDRSKTISSPGNRLVLYSSPMYSLPTAFAMEVSPSDALRLSRTTPMPLAVGPAIDRALVPPVPDPLATVDPAAAAAAATSAIAASSILNLAYRSTITRRFLLSWPTLSTSSASLMLSMGVVARDRDDPAAAVLGGWRWRSSRTTCSSSATRRRSRSSSAIEGSCLFRQLTDSDQDRGRTD